MDEDIMNAVESLFGKDVKIVDCETSSTVQQEEVLLINGVPVKLDGLPSEDASAIKRALLDGQMPALEHLNELLFRAGLAQKPIEVETSLTVKSSLTTTEEVLVSRNGQVLDERVVETKEHMNHQSHQREIFNPIKQQTAISRATPERALKYGVNSSSTVASASTHAGSPLGRQLNHTFSNASMMSTSSAITDSDQLIGSASNISTATTIGDKSSNISSWDSGHDGLFHSLSLSTPWPPAARDTQTDSMYCDIPSSADETESVSTSILNPQLRITEPGDKAQADDCQSQIYAKHIPTAGTIDDLVKLLSTSTDKEIEFSFLLCARLFLPPHKLLTQIAHKCQSSKLIRLINYWFEICPYDFRDEDMQQAIKKLIADDNHRSDELVAFFERIPGALEQLDSNRQAQLQYLLIKQPSTSSLGRQSSIKSLKRFAANVYKSDNVLNICSSPFELAHQLYAIEYAYLSQLRLEEFLEIVGTMSNEEFKRCMSSSGSISDTKQANCNIAAYIQWFNRLNYLTASEILKLSKKSQRVQMIDFWIETALECFNTGNFNSLMAILTALNMTAVSRLKKSWAKVQMTKFSGLEHQMDPSSNFLNYRSTMKAAIWRLERESANKIERAIIPFFSLFLKDIYIINESNETQLTNGRLNFEKCINLGLQLRNFYKWQQLECPYEQTAKIVSYLKGSGTLNEESLMKASYEIEPPDSSEEKDQYKTLKAAKKSNT